MDVSPYIPNLKVWGLRALYIIISAIVPPVLELLDTFLEEDPPWPAVRVNLGWTWLIATVLLLLLGIWIEIQKKRS
jgi:hypothetical protein